MTLYRVLTLWILCWCVIGGVLGDPVKVHDPAKAKKTVKRPEPLKPWHPYFDWMKAERDIASEERIDPETGTWGDDSVRTKARVEDVVDDVPTLELDRTSHYQVVIGMKGEHAAHLAAREAGFEYLGPLGDLPNLHRIRRPWSADAGPSNLHAIADSYEAQLPLSRELRSIWNGEALHSQYPMQWNLHGRFGDYSNHVLPNLNIEEAWKRFGATGAGVNIGVADEGVDVTNDDIRPSHNAELDVIVHPEGKFGSHGTGVAGLIAAQPNADCITGISPNAKWGDIPIINHATHTDGDEAASLATRVNRTRWGNDAFNIISASWGPTDSGLHASKPGPLASAALELGAAEGVTYVFAAGNGGESGDFTVLDGYVSYPVGVIAVGAVDYDNGRAWYSEPGTSVFVVAPSSGRGYFVIASAKGAFGCTMQGSGTSFAAPQITGLLALMDETNPIGHLSSRDHRHMLTLCSEPVDRDNTRDRGLLGLWKRNGAGYLRSDSYGFGLPNATNCLAYARAWQPQAMPALTSTHLDLTLSEKNAAQGETLYGQWTIREEHTSVRFLEATQLSISYGCGPSFYADKPDLSAVSLILSSPSGMSSEILTSRTRLIEHDLAWNFTTYDFWGESPLGAWTLTVINDNPKGCLVHLDDVGLIFYGTQESVLDAVLPQSART